MNTRQAGFTLLEIMVALVVFSLVLVGLTQGTRFGLQAWNGQAAMIDQRGDINAVDTILRNLITRMDPGDDVDPPNIIGRPDALAFTTQLPLALADATSGDADVSLTLNQAHQLILRWTTHLHATRLGGTPQIQSAVLLGGVQQMTLRYWDPSAGKWLTTWVSRAPPGLVGIKLIFPAAAKTARPDWPEIVVAPMRQAPN